MHDAPPPPPDLPPVPPTDPPPLSPPPPSLTVPQPPPFLPVPPAGTGASQGSQFASDGKTSNILMYVGIGCGLLALMAIVAVVLGVGWGVRKVSEIGAHPDKFTAEMIAKADPNLEVVASDPVRNEITVRFKSTGDTRTVSYKDVAQGKLTSFTATDAAPAHETATTDAAPGPGRPASSNGVVATPSGSWTGAPAWFPAMEGLTLGGAAIQSSTGAQESIHLTATGTASTADIVTFYSDELDKLGFTITRQSQSAGALTSERIEAADDTGGRRVTIHVTRPTPDSPAGVVVTIETPARH